MGNPLQLTFGQQMKCPGGGVQVVVPLTIWWRFASFQALSVAAEPQIRGRTCCSVAEPSLDNLGMLLQNCHGVPPSACRLIQVFVRLSCLPYWTGYAIPPANAA